MQFLKRLGDALDGADDKATKSDLHAITREVAGGAIDAAGGAAGHVKSLDFGLVQGWNELASQIGTDLKAAAEEASDQVRRLNSRQQQKQDKDGSGCVKACVSLGSTPASSPPTPPTVNESETGIDVKSSPTVKAILPAAPQVAPHVLQRLADLQERVKELEERESTRTEARLRLQDRFVEVEAELQKLQEEDESVSETEEACPSSTQNEEAVEQTAARMAAMRREFFERENVATASIRAFKDEISEIGLSCEPLQVEKEFWHEQMQRAMRARGLTEIPAEIRASAARAEKSEGGSGTAPSAAIAANTARNRAREEAAAAAERDAENEHDERSQESEALHAQYVVLEGRLEELMRGSDDAMSRIDEQRRRERDLEASLVAASALANTEVSALEDAVERSRQAEMAKTEAVQLCAEVTKKARESPTASGVYGEALQLRRQAEDLQGSIKDATEENSALHARLRKCRDAAVADLERAVPLSSESSFWQSVDGPTLKVVTMLVRSSCLRRTFALHVLGTYVWFFFLIFWLEKH
eukprot:TRINITY_DN49816_c0_g1_i1.p1 TRINITY_DN49816_c0_g1~~TRINITY_DN49816_c0_g1_i1.p1  ORF type:complete len:530 (-),score=132.75 TRINITY_DN49816_c0_g1_i1:182-1771(-)